MVDQLDRRLEAKLRTVLRDEAEAIPFTLRLANLERVRSERSRARRTQRWSIAAAAVVVVVVGGAALAAALRPTGPAASPGDSFSGLPSFQRLADARTGGGSPLMQLDEVAGTQAHQWQFGLPRGAYPFQFLVACLGPGPLVVSLAADSVPPVEIGTATCDGGVWNLGWDGTEEQALLTATSVSLVVQAQPETAWRMMVADDGSGRVVQRFDGSSRLFRLPSFDWLVQQRSAGATELARGSGLNTASDTSESILRGIGSASGIEISLFCVGSPLKVSLAAAGSAATAGEPQVLFCGETGQGILWQRADATRNVSEVRLSVPPGTAWEAIVWDLSSAPDAFPPTPGTPSR